MRRTGLPVLCIALAALSLGACNMTTPSAVTTSQIRVEDYMKTVTLPVGRVDKVAVDVAANDYRRNSKSVARLVVPYLKGQKGAMAAAQNTGMSYKRAFAEFGLTDLEVNYAPTLDTDAARSAVLAYTATLAHPPKHCQRMPGHEGTETLDAIEGYKPGCEIATIQSKMISRPGDLMGRGGTPDSTSRREASVTEGYMSGRSNPPISGFTPLQGVSGGTSSTGQTTTTTQ